MKCCLEYNLLERILFKAVARKAKCTNIKEISNIFLMLDSQHHNFFDFNEFKIVCNKIHPDFDESTCLKTFKAIDVNNDGKIE